MCYFFFDGLSNLFSALQLPFCFGNTLLFYCWFMLTAIQLQRISYCKLFLDFSARFVEFSVIVVNHIFIFCNLLINEVSCLTTIFCICNFVLFVYILNIFVYQQSNANEQMFILQKNESRLC